MGQDGNAAACRVRVTKVVAARAAEFAETARHFVELAANERLVTALDQMLALQVVK